MDVQCVVLVAAVVLVFAHAASPAAAQTRSTQNLFRVTDECASLYLDNDTAISWDAAARCGPVTSTGSAGLGGSRELSFEFEGLPPDPCKTLLVLRDSCDVVRSKQYVCQAAACTAAAWSDWGLCEGHCGTGVARRNRTVAVTPPGVPIWWAYVVEVHDVVACELRECEPTPLSDSFIQWLAIVGTIVFCLFCIPLTIRCHKRKPKHEGRFSHAVGGDRARAYMSHDSDDEAEDRGDGGGDVEMAPRAGVGGGVAGGRLSDVDPGWAEPVKPHASGGGKAKAARGPGKQVSVVNGGGAGAGGAAGAHAHGGARGARRVAPRPLPEDEAVDDDDGADADGVGELEGALPPASVRHGGRGDVSARGDSTARTIDTVSTAITTARSEL